MSAHEVADVITGPPFREWWLDARVYRLPLPVGWTMLGPADVPQCWFVSASLAVYVQTANRAPEGSEWEAAGQRVVARGDLGDRGRWVEVEYQHEGDVWRQRHVVMRGGTPRNVMITAQAPAGEIDEAVGLQQWLVERIVIAG